MQVILLLIIGLFSAFATAQDGASLTSTEAEAPAEIKTLKKIEVTGSYIKRVDEEAPNPVQTISSETLKKSGYNSVADVIRDNAFTSGGARESANSSNPGAATGGIGPFGADSILVLLNGNRMPKIGGDNSVDLNLIPTAAIEKVEILTDGASATYGSDAIGGVMNFITKKDFNGGTVSVGQNTAQAGGAARTNFSATFGKTYKKGSIMGVLQYRNNAELASADRPFTKITNLAQQGSLTSQVGQWTDTNGDNQFLTGSCPANQLVTDGGQTYCMFDYSKYSWELPKIAQYSTMLTGEYRFSEYLKSKTLVNVTARDVGTRMAPAPGTIKLTQAQAANIGINNAQTNPLDGLVDVNYRILDGGTRDTDDRTFAYNVAQTFEGKIAGSWNWDLTSSFADSRRRNDGRGFANRTILSEMVANNEYKILLPPGQQGNISRALFNPYEVQQSRQAEIRALATGQLSDSASLAVGTSTSWQTYRTEVDNTTAANNSYGGNGGNGAGSRSFQAAFTELSIFPVETVEIGLAARYDRYSDFGNTFNPKLSLSWQANDKLMFRTSIGTGFRAPNLGDLYNGGSLNFPYFLDTIGCNDAGGTGPSCSTRQYQVVSRANPNLKQETSLFQNFGFLLAPKKNWNIESNYFVAKIQDSVGGLQMSQVMRAANVFGEDFLRDKYQIQIVRNGGTITQVNMLSAYNISSSIRQGINFRVSNQSKANFGSFPVDFVFDMNHVQFLKTVGEAFPGLGLQNSQDNYFKNTMNITGSHRSHAVRGTLRTLSGGDKNRNIGRIGDVGYGSLRTHTEFDLNYAKQNIFRKVNLNIGVKNLFDAPRPLDNTAQVALDTSVYDPIGRYYYTTLDYTF